MRTHTHKNPTHQLAKLVVGFEPAQQAAELVVVAVVRQTGLWWVRRGFESFRV